MRILFITDYPPEEMIGGSVRVFCEQCTGLANRHHDIHVLTRNENFKNGFDISKKVSIWKYTIKTNNHYSLFLSTFKNSRTVFENLTDKFKYDLINFHQPFSAMGVLRSPKSLKLKKIYTCHSLSFEEYWSRNRNSKKFITYVSYIFNGYMRKGIENYVLKKSDKIVVLSEYTKKKLSLAYNVPDEKCIIAYGGVDLEKFYPSNKKSDLRQKLNIPQDKIILFTVRNLVNRMGLENLIAALKYVIKENPNIYLILGGAGPLRNHLYSLAEKFGLKNHICFTGFIEEEKLAEYYRAADIFILPTKELEGFGLVTLEALASGLPVLGTSVGGTKEILGGLYSDFLFDNFGPESMSKKILEKCKIKTENPQYWTKICHQCRNFIEINYSWKKNIDTLEELFIKTLQN